MDPGFSGAVGGIRTAQMGVHPVSPYAAKCRSALQILDFIISPFHYVSKGVDQFYRDKGRYKGQKQVGIRENTDLSFCHRGI